MKPISSVRIFLASASLLFAPLTLHAAVVFNDTFDSGTGNWYRYGTSGTLTNTGEQLSWTRNATGPQEAIGRSFATQTIGVGESIRLSFDFTQSAGTSANTNLIRAGLYNVGSPITADNWGNNNIGAWSGYYSFIRDDSSSGNVARQHSGTTTKLTADFGNPGSGPSEGGVAITNPSNSTQFDIVNGATYQGVFEVFRTSATEMTTLFTLSSGSTTHFSVQGITSAVQGDFNTVVLRTSTNTAAQLFDNIQVSVIPEPSTALLGGLGLLALLRRRR